jgi:hypothetical protein
MTKSVMAVSAVQAGIMATIDHDMLMRRREVASHQIPLALGTAHTSISFFRSHERIPSGVEGQGG